MSSDNELCREEHNRENPHDLKQVEQTLAAFSPRTPQLDRDRLMFLAGTLSPAAHGRERRAGTVAERGSAAKRAWAWPAATAAMAATSLALAVALFLRPEPRVQIVVRDRPAMAPAAPTQVATAAAQSTPGLPAADGGTRVLAYRSEARQPEVPANNYVRTREVALRMGVDALGSPRSAGGSTGSLTYMQWLAGLSDTQTKPNQPSAAPLPNM